MNASLYNNSRQDVSKTNSVILLPKGAKGKGVIGFMVRSLDVSNGPGFWMSVYPGCSRNFGNFALLTVL